MGRQLEGRVLYWTAAYLVDGLLIDTGCPHTAEELVEFLRSQHLTVAVNTHFHEDHIGANHLLKEKLGIRVLASPESVSLIQQPARLKPYQEVVWGFPLPTRVDALADRIETDHFCFRVIDTPGHSIGHIALLEPREGWCFSGDLFISIEPKALRPEEDIGEIARSMRRLLQIKTERLVLFTSLGNVFQDGCEALQSCLDYLHRLWQRAKQLETEGLSAAEIRDRLFGRESILADLTGGDISSENMVRSLLRANMPD